MGLWSKVNALISGIPDNRLRIEIASTINFLYNVYAQGGVNEDQLRGELKEICRTVVELSNPMLLPEDVNDRAEVLADELIRDMKIEALMHRVRVRFGGAMR